MTKDEAAKALGVSVRTLNRFQQQEWISPTYSKHPTANCSVAEYSEEEIQRCRSHMAGLPLVNGNGKGSTAQALELTQAGAIETIAARANPTNLALLAEAIASAVEKSHRTPVVELDKKLVLSLTEASKLSGIPRERLKNARLIDGAKLANLAPELGRGYRIKRLDLIEYIAEF